MVHQLRHAGRAGIDNAERQPNAEQLAVQQLDDASEE
jgi:hypothetical protein